LQYVAVYCSVLQCVAVCCSVCNSYVCAWLQPHMCDLIIVTIWRFWSGDTWVCCSVLQCVAVCCSVLQCVAATHVWPDHRHNLAFLIRRYPTCDDCLALWKKRDQISQKSALQVFYIVNFLVSRLLRNFVFDQEIPNMRWLLYYLKKGRLDFSKVSSLCILYSKLFLYPQWLPCFLQRGRSNSQKSVL